MVGMAAIPFGATGSGDMRPATMLSGLPAVVCGNQGNRNVTRSPALSAVASP